MDTLQEEAETCHDQTVRWLPCSICGKKKDCKTECVVFIKYVKKESTFQRYMNWKAFERIGNLPKVNLKAIA